MVQNPDHALTPMAQRLALRANLTDADRDAILALPFSRRSLLANEFIAWEADKAQHCCLLLSGFACGQANEGGGRRQITSFHMKGDLVDLGNVLLGTVDHNTQMLTDGEIVLITINGMRELALRHPAVGLGLWHDTLIEASIVREAVLNIGRRDARTRIAHLLCEFALRFELAGLGKRTTYELPITQEQFADAVALTPVHVNRTLMKLEQDGLINRMKRVIRIVDWETFVKVADFDPRYLHVPAAG